MEEDLQVGKLFLDTHVTCGVLNRMKGRLIVIKISQISVANRFGATPGNVDLIDLNPVNKQG